MKTLFLFEEVPEESYFFELEGDYSNLNDIYINSSSDKEKVQLLSELVFTSDGIIKINKMKEPTKDWDIFIKCGLIL